MLLIVLAGLAAYAWAADLTADDIIKRMSNRAESNSSIAESKMTIIDANGAQRVRQMRTRTKKINGLNHVVTTFLAPPEVRGIKFLVIENPNGENEQRIFMPAVPRVRAITASNRNDAFVGSTFSYGDLQIRNPNEGKHTRLKDMVLNGQDCYVVQTIPKDPSTTDYSKLLYWVRKDNFLPIRGEFFNKDGKLWKVLEVPKMEKKPDGTWLVKLTKMSDVIARRATVMEILSYQINVPIDDGVFTDRFLSDESQE
jgi:hypothetical protein